LTDGSNIETNEPPALKSSIFQKVQLPSAQP